MDYQPTLTDLPSADSIFEIPPFDVGGWVPVAAEATPPSGEIEIAAIEIGTAELETIGMHERDLLTPPKPQAETDNIPADIPAPDIEPVPQKPAQTVQSS